MTTTILGTLPGLISFILGAILGSIYSPIHWYTIGFYILGWIMGVAIYHIIRTRLAKRHHQAA